jgi:hypothetical protein
MNVLLILRSVHYKMVPVTNRKRGRTVFIAVTDEMVGKMLNFNSFVWSSLLLIGSFS